MLPPAFDDFPELQTVRYALSFPVMMSQPTEDWLSDTLTGWLRQVFVQASCVTGPFDLYLEPALRVRTSDMIKLHFVVSTNQVPGREFARHFYLRNWNDPGDTWSEFIENVAPQLMAFLHYGAKVIRSRQLPEYEPVHPVPDPIEEIPF